MTDPFFPIRLEANRGVAESIRRLLKSRGVEAKVTKRRWLVEVHPDDADRARDILTHEIEYADTARAREILTHEVEYDGPPAGGGAS